MASKVATRNQRRTKADDASQEDRAMRLCPFMRLRKLLEPPRAIHGGVLDDERDPQSPPVQRGQFYGREERTTQRGW